MSDTLSKLSLSEAFDALLLDLQARRASARTLQHYRYQLGAFLADMTAQEVTGPGAITPAHVRAHLVKEQQRGLSNHTVHGRARAIRAWLNFLVREGELAESPMRKVKMPKPDNRILPAFTPADVQALIDACLNGRDKAIVLCLLDTGLRASEFVALNVGDVDMASGAVMVRQGKGGKDRQVYMGAKTRQALQRYLRRRKDAGTMGASPPLWVSLATMTKGNRLRVAGLRQVLTRLGRRAGVDHCHPHTFRRTFALWSLRAGMDIYSLQRLMGHADLTMLRRYLALVEADLQTAHRRHGPVNSHL